MITQRPDIVRRQLVMQLRALGALGLRAHFAGPSCEWPWRAGMGLLITWSGERLPYPTIEPWRRDRRQAIIAGVAPGLSGSVETFADLDFADSVHHFTVVAIGRGGVPAGVDPFEVRTRVRVSGEWLGLLPNTPALVQARRLPGNLPHVTWSLSRAAEQTPPAEFRVFAADADTAFDFDDPIGVVAFTGNQRRYAWTGSALAVGTRRWYTVRAASADGVLSLIPRNGRCPAGEYDAVEREWCAVIDIPDGPPSDVGTLGLEAIDAY